MNDFLKDNEYSKFSIKFLFTRISLLLLLEMIFFIQKHVYQDIHTIFNLFQLFATSIQIVLLWLFDEFGLFLLIFKFIIDLHYDFLKIALSIPLFFKILVSFSAKLFLSYKFEPFSWFCKFLYFDLSVLSALIKKLLFV